jgi:Transcriptional regulator containing an amidase domain and an AraC-type DNA-binding HTH domain
VKTQIVIYDGFDELDAVAPYEVLRAAGRRGAPFEVELAHLDGPREVQGSQGLLVQATARLAERLDLLVVPGGRWSDNASPIGARVEAERGLLPKAIAGLHDGGATIASVCTGAMLLVAAGLMRGRPATTHHVAKYALKASGAELIDARVVDDGEVITAGGVTSGLDLGLWLVERTAGAVLALELERHLEYERRGTVWRRGAR